MINRRILQALAVVSAAVFLSSCGGSNKKYETAMCALADVSGTYSKEKGTVANLIKAGILPKMLPGDSLTLITIDSNSYNDKNIKAQLTLDYRPSEANLQKLKFARVLDKFAKGHDWSRYTDISGAMMLCDGILKKSGAGTQAMFIFSDMKEELRHGLRRHFSRDEFKNINIAAMNVVRLHSDSTNPQVYRARLKRWKKRVLKHGAKSWKANLEPTDMTQYIDDLR